MNGKKNEVQLHEQCIEEQITLNELEFEKDEQFYNVERQNSEEEMTIKDMMHPKNNHRDIHYTQLQRLQNGEGAIRYGCYRFTTRPWIFLKAFAGAPKLR